MRRIGAHDAKTHLSRLLDDVAHGEEIVIMKQRVAVALLTRAPVSPPIGASEAIAGLMAFRRDHRLDDLSIRELIDEGSR